MMSLQRNPEERFQSMSEVREALESITASHMQKTSKPISKKLKVFRNRSKKVLLRRSTFAVAVVLAILGGLAILFWAFHERTQHIVLLEGIAPGDEALLTHNYKEALVHYNNGLAVAEQYQFFMGEDTTAMVLDRLGLYYQERHMYKESADAFQRALDMRLNAETRPAFKPDMQTIAVNHDNLAYQLTELQKFEAAEKHFQAANDIFETLQRQQHANPERFANVLHHYSILLGRKGDMNRAAELEAHSQQLAAQ